jgi:CobQ-like glutamine amidotransferase family enzyme
MTDVPPTPAVLQTEVDERLSLTLGHLYPQQLNMYGDRGNIITLTQRCARRGVNLQVVSLDIGDALDPAAYDLLFIGGGQDKEQDEVARDLREVKAGAMRAAIEQDMPTLAVCGGYQLLARYYHPAEGPDLEGIGVFDAWTIHKGKKVARCIGNIAITWGESTLVGFENHGGRTYLGPQAIPLGTVLAGHGNNNEDHAEGCVYRNVFGTYLHGSLLPKNPHLADYILGLALSRTYGERGAAIMRQALDDAMEWRAHEHMLRRLGVTPRAHAYRATSAPHLARA